MRVFRRFFASSLAAAVVFASVGAQAAQFDHANSVTIRNSTGGKMLVYSLRAKKLAAQGRGVRFAGRCESACTMYLSMPSNLTCIMPGASFGFHLPRGASREEIRLAADYMMNSYPHWVREWLQSKRGLSWGMKRMPYRYASRFMQTCPTQAKPAARVTGLSRQTMGR